MVSRNFLHHVQIFKCPKFFLFSEFGTEHHLQKPVNHFDFEINFRLHSKVVKELFFFQTTVFVTQESNKDVHENDSDDNCSKHDWDVKQMVFKIRVIDSPENDSDI